MVRNVFGLKNNKNDAFHSHCFACGQDNDLGLQMAFKHGPKGSTCKLRIPSSFQSYAGVVHGGIVATILDAAMVHALKRQIRGDPVTCRLDIRYLRPVRPGDPLTISARMIGHRRKVILTDAELFHTDECCARAHGAFIIREHP